MKTITEIEIERFVRFPNELSGEELREIKSFIQENKEAKAIADFFIEFYSEFDQLSRPSVVKLDFYKPKKMISGPLVLAADSGDSNVLELVTKATYSSEADGTLVRILEDTKRKQYQIHVLSKFLKNEERVLINIDQQPHDIVTARGGKIKNIKKEVLSDIDWKHASVVLRLPTSVCEFDPNKDEIPYTLCDECTLSMKDNVVSFTTSEDALSRILFEQDDKTELMYIENQELSFIADPTRPFVLYLYT